MGGDGIEIIFIIIVLVLFATFWAGDFIGNKSLRKDMFDRGFMVECVGKTGYHLDCNE